MKQLTIILLTAGLIFKGAGSFAQIDEAKMERDLRVASGVLTSLLNNNDKDYFFGGREPEGNYVEGFGLIFSIEDQMIFGYSYKGMERSVKIAHRDAQRSHREVERNLREKVESSDNEPVVVPTPPVPSAGASKISEGQKQVDELIIESENATKERTQKLKEAFETFLVDYSQLVSQLNPTDKILLTTKNNSMDFVFVGKSYGNIKGKNSSTLSAEMLVKDHNDYRAGKLSREKLLAKIKFVEKANVERKPDLDMFSNMLKTNYNSKYTETYFISSLPKYEFLTGLGVVYSVKVYSSYEDSGFYRIPGAKKSGLSEDERDKMVEAMYPQFVEGFKENIIRYGSTIKSLETDDKLIVKVKMTKCDTCSFPSAIEFMVDKSVLNQFSKGSLTLAQAKGKVKRK